MKFNGKKNRYRGSGNQGLGDVVTLMLIVAVILLLSVVLSRLGSGRSDEGVDSDIVSVESSSSSTIDKTVEDGVEASEDKTLPITEEEGKKAEDESIATSEVDESSLFDSLSSSGVEAYVESDNTKDDEVAEETVEEAVVTSDEPVVLVGEPVTTVEVEVAPEEIAVEMESEIVSGEDATAESDKLQEEEESEPEREDVSVDETEPTVEVEVAPEEIAVEMESEIVSGEDATAESDKLQEEEESEPEREDVSVDETEPTVEEETEQEKSPLLYVSQTAPLSSYEEKPLTANVDWNGYSMTIDAYTGRAAISYPSVVTNDDVYAFAAYAWENYSDYLSCVELRVIGEGKAEVTYPPTYGKDEFDEAVDTLRVEISLYIESIIEETKSCEDVAEVAPSAATTADTPQPEIVAVSDTGEESEVETVVYSPEPTESIVLLPEMSADAEEAQDNIPAIGFKKQSLAVWGTPYGIAEKVEDGKSFNIRRFLRSYVWALNVEYDYKVTKMFTLGFTTGYEGVIFHVGGYKRQVPFLVTLGFVPYESEKSRLDLDLGFGLDIVQSIGEKTLSPIADFSLSYRYKLGELFLGVGMNVRFEYTISNKEIRFEVMPVRLALGYTF